MPSDQENRLAVIRSPEDEENPFERRRRHDIASVVNRSALNSLDGDAGEFVDVVRNLVDVEPFEIEDIPLWATRTIRESDGTVGAIGVLFRGIRSWDAEQCIAYQESYGEIPVESGTVQLADAAFITADIIRTVKEDGIRMGGARHAHHHSLYLTALD